MGIWLQNHGVELAVFIINIPIAAKALGWKPSEKLGQNMRSALLGLLGAAVPVAVFAIVRVLWLQQVSLWWLVVAALVWPIWLQRALLVHWLRSFAFRDAWRGRARQLARLSRPLAIPIRRSIEHQQLVYWFEKHPVPLEWVLVQFRVPANPGAAICAGVNVCDADADEKVARLYVAQNGTATVRAWKDGEEHGSLQVQGEFPPDRWHTLKLQRIGEGFVYRVDDKSLQYLVHWPAEVTLALHIQVNAGASGTVYVRGPWLR